MGAPQIGQLVNSMQVECPHDAIELDDVESPTDFESTDDEGFELVESTVVIDGGVLSDTERAETKNRYKVGPLKLMRAEQALEAQGYEILGYYHSHPDHPARYSGYDKEHALPNMSYLIVSVMEGFAKEIQSWRLREDRCAMDEERIESLFSSKSDEIKI